MSEYQKVLDSNPKQEIDQPEVGLFRRGLRLRLGLAGDGKRRWRGITAGINFRQSDEDQSSADTEPDNTDREARLWQEVEVEEELVRLEANEHEVDSRLVLGHPAGVAARISTGNILVGRSSSVADNRALNFFCEAPEFRSQSKQQLIRPHTS